ncbi:hypothetical protein IPM09_00925 [Candidatus Saccharibacteria bacterium]|nr:MAG: hypothetical protein IPM09_00925 [Candidatus Saccharibacteria bacterium]
MVHWRRLGEAPLGEKEQALFRQASGGAKRYIHNFAEGKTRWKFVPKP